MTVATELPPVIEAPVRPAAANRVALGLVFLGFLQLAEGVFSLVLSFKAGGQINLLAPFGFLWFWATALIVWKDKRIIWPLLTYFSTLSAGCLVGAAIGLGLGLPGKLLATLPRAEPFLFWFYAGYGAVAVIFFLWLAFEGEAIHTLWPGSFRRPQSLWLQPKAFAAYLLVPTALFTLGILALLQGGWTREAVERARRDYGSTYDYITINYHVATINGHTTHRAVVVAYSRSEIRELPLNWED
ncbi:hypothetical protein SAMN05444173_0456 [Opitutus sp. GAS368]|jgi:hypothetical protein|nr:hypothetical protein SAMN05444173_0456 [Opitutus sp. GAS368]